MTIFRKDGVDMRGLNITDFEDLMGDLNHYGYLLEKYNQLNAARGELYRATASAELLDMDRELSRIRNEADELRPHIMAQVTEYGRTVRGVYLRAQVSRVVDVPGWATRWLKAFFRFIGFKRIRVSFHRL